MVTNLHGGDITMRTSDEDNETVVTVTLPCYVMIGANMKILIVDDDEANQIILTGLLKKYGECICEDDGKKALGTFVEAFYDNSPFDLILLDIMMPNIDGQKTLKIIRQIEKRWDVKPGDESKVIMVTALNSPTEVTKAYFQGDATGYMVKPVNLNELKNMIDKFFERNELHM